MVADSLGGGKWPLFLLIDREELANEFEEKKKTSTTHLKAVSLAQHTQHSRELLR